MQIVGVYINDLCFTDDTALLVESTNELQAMVNRAVEVRENLSMEVNVEKTEKQHKGKVQKALTS